MHAQQRICTISINLNISNRVARSIPKIRFENTDSQIRLHTATDCRLLPSVSVIACTQIQVCFVCTN